MSGDAFDKRRQALEEEFFKKHNQKLADKLRQELDRKQTREELIQLTGIRDPGVLDTLIGLNVDKSTFAAFGLYPLVEVAWADGQVDEKERAAFIRAAGEQSLVVGQADHSPQRILGTFFRRFAVGLLVPEHVGLGEFFDAEQRHAAPAAADGQNPAVRGKIDDPGCQVMRDQRPDFPPSLRIKNHQVAGDRRQNQKGRSFEKLQVAYGSQVCVKG